ncbi:MAG: YkgJ family cysteine cluster protein [Cytophagales bacterium]|nr:YkgJ family cysteine cluster protein [Armatimonadota bacterium]
MSVLLNMVSGPESARGAAADPAPAAIAAWEQFVARRDAQTARMALGVCDGCDGCGLRCMDGFTVSRAEREAVEAYLAAQAPEEVQRVADQEKTVPWPGAEDTGATVTFCRYRDTQNRRCSIYPVRPTVCRLFGHTPWLPCPIEAVPQVPDGSPELWRDYLAFERRTWSEWEHAEGDAELTQEIP